MTTTYDRPREPAGTTAGTTAGTGARAAGGGPAGANRVAGIALILAVLYGGLRLYWQLGHMPRRLSPIGTDLVAVTGWNAVALCGAAALLAAALRTPRWSTGAARQVLIAAAFAVGLVLVAAGAMLLLDVVGAILPGLGLGFYPLGALSRSACAGSGVLLGMAALSHRRRTGGGCPACGRTATAAAAAGSTPRWAFAAAYVAILGCLVRIGAQAAVGFAENPMSGGASATLFEIGFVLGGTLLPLALVHSFGRTWPHWVPGLAGRRVPRRLVGGPGLAISAGLVVYFGLMLLQMVAERLRGENPFPPSGGLDLPETFFWVAVPGYFVWGAGMAVAALAYHRRTRPPCRSCGR